MTLTHQQLEEASFWLVRYLQHAAWTDDPTGSAVAALRLLEASKAPRVELGTEILSAILRQPPEDWRPFDDLAMKILSELPAVSEDNWTTVAVRILDVYFRHRKIDPPPGFRMFDQNPSQATINLLHSIALTEDRERLIDRIRLGIAHGPDKGRALREAVSRYLDLDDSSCRE
jgi:hypothetical protein